MKVALSTITLTLTHKNYPNTSKHVKNTTLLYLSQDRIWIFIMSYVSLSSFEVRCDCSCCWYWWNCWPWLSFHSGSVCSGVSGYTRVLGFARRLRKKLKKLNAFITNFMCTYRFWRTDVSLHVTLYFFNITIVDALLIRM